MTTDTAFVDHAVVKFMRGPVSQEFGSRFMEFGVRVKKLSSEIFRLEGFAEQPAQEGISLQGECISCLDIETMLGLYIFDIF